jgi:hypothetical protein
MRNFWESFEKRAVTMAWVNKMKNRGVVSRSLHTPAKKETLKKEIERFYKDKVKRRTVGGKHVESSKHWRHSKNPEAVHTSIRYENATTKNSPHLADAFSNYIEKDPYFFKDYITAHGGR